MSEENFSSYVDNIVNKWSDIDLQRNIDIVSYVYPYSQELESKEILDFKNDINVRRSIVKVTMRIISFFGYRIEGKYTVEQIKPIMRVEDGVVFGLCNIENLPKIRRILTFFDKNNMPILSALLFLVICNALKKSPEFKKIVLASNVLPIWLKTQKYLSEAQIQKLQSNLSTPESKRQDPVVVQPEKAPVKKQNTFECNICASEKRSSEKVICAQCKFECCKTCFKRHLLSSSKLNPSCMNCNAVLSLDFVYDNTDEGFYNKEYRNHRMDILLSMEKSLLPTTQYAANRELKNREEMVFRGKMKKWVKEAEKKMESYKAKNIEYLNKDNPKKANEYRNKVNDMHERIFAFKDVNANRYRGHHIERLKYITDESKPFSLEEFIRFFERPVPEYDYGYLDLRALLDGRQRNNPELDEKGDDIPKKPVFIGPCPEADCKGYLDENAVCGLCKKEACKSCRLPKHEGKCDPNTVATVKMMDRDTKRCPKCNVPIYKTEGCDQMWCPSCHTAFSWSTGEIEKGRIHNPHYYQWMRAQGGGKMRREPGDERCEGVERYGDEVEFRQVLQTLRRLGVKQHEELIAAVHALIGDIRAVHLRRIAVDEDPDSNRDLRVSYLLGDYKDEKAWFNKLKTREKSKEKRRSETLVLQMLVNTLETILENIDRSTSGDEVNVQVAQLSELQSYVNKEFIKIEKRFKNKSFHLKNWTFDFRPISKRD